ncbi:MAG: hypothetical protein ABI810_01840 [Sphingomonas bacterium]
MRIGFRTPEGATPRLWSRRAGTIAALMLATVSLHGCNSAPKAESRATASDSYKPPFKTVASIKELMDSTVDPAADGLWDSVAIISNEKGVEKREPHTDEEWQAVRRHTVTLIESMNLVMMNGRHAAPPGTKPKLGELSPDQIDVKIAANRPEFDLFADGVRGKAMVALDAIDRKDTKALFTVGSDIDQACEGCHVAFWYPNSPAPAN